MPIAGGAVSLPLKSDGTVWAWGGGYLGNGSTNSNVPVQVSGLTGVVAIAGCQFNSLALKTDGTVWTWGPNFFGQLGNRGNGDSRVPVQVSGLTGVVAIAGAGSGTRAHSLAALSGTIPLLKVNPSRVTFAASGGAQTITVTNSGAAPLTISNIILTGINTSDFTTSGMCSEVSLSPTQSCTLSVTFAPAAQGTRNAALLLVANAPGSPIIVQLSGSRSHADGTFIRRS
jgi:hypothetical protein